MRRDIEDRHNDPYAGPKATIRLLCVGGSLGAKAFSQLLPKALGNLKPEQRARFTLVQQVTDPDDRKRLTHEYQAMGLNAEIKGYINDMADQLSQADLVIARSGSTTVHEIAALVARLYLSRWAYTPMPSNYTTLAICNKRVPPGLCPKPILQRAG